MTGGKLRAHQTPTPIQCHVNGLSDTLSVVLSLHVHCTGVLVMLQNFNVSTVQCLTHDIVVRLYNKLQVYTSKLISLILY